MELAPDYLQILQRGVAALLAIGEELEEAVDRGVARPEQELTLRDVTGLAGRLAATSPGEWRTIWAGHAFTGQDIGVLSELIGEYDAPSPYSDDQAAHVRQTWARDLRALRDFLDAWRPSEFTTELPDDYHAGLFPEAASEHRDQHSELAVAPVRRDV
jgi:hypothetical protein